jgi:hypothetical protein
MPIDEQVARQRASDRKVRKLVEREKRGRPVTLGDALKLCPYRTLLALPGTPLTPSTQNPPSSSPTGL